MDIYALVGPSGTGKSHRAMALALEHGMDTIIDDGLLIKDGRRLAGSSAKGEKTAIGSVKRAIFHHKEHQDEVKAALSHAAPEGLMILGTSKRMVDRIAMTLDLPQPSRYYMIDEVSTAREVATAVSLRRNFGMHVIPVPMVEVRDDLQGYLMRPIRYFMRMKSGHKQGENTIIQPKFDAMGKLVITGQALDQMIVFLCAGVPGVAKVGKAHTDIQEGNAVIRMEFTAQLPCYIPDVVGDIRRLLEDRILVLCGIYVDQLSIVVRNIVV